MANTIILKKSSTAASIPAAGSLQPGELAVNLADQKLYSKTVGGVVILVGTGTGGGGGGGGVASSTDVNGLTMPYSATTPASPAADNVRLFCTEVANRAMPAFVGPSGLDTALQPFLARNKMAFFTPAGNSATAFTLLGTNTLSVVSNSGTAFTARNVATTNILTRAKRIAAIGTGTAGTLGSIRETVAQYTTGTGAGLGGFHFIARFGISDSAAAISGARGFVGFSSATTQPTNVEPSALLNSVGLAQLSTDATQWYMVYGGSAAQTPIALGTDLGAPSLRDTIFDLSMFSSPSQNGVISYEVTNVGSGVKVNGTLTPATAGVQTPLSTTLLASRFWRCNNAAAVAVGIDLISFYIETDQ